MRHASVDRAKSISSQCRNHGLCAYCRRSRTFQMIKLRAKARFEERARDA